MTADVYAGDEWRAWRREKCSIREVPPRSTSSPTRTLICSARWRSPEPPQCRTSRVPHGGGAGWHARQSRHWSIAHNFQAELIARKLQQLTSVRDVIVTYASAHTRSP